MRKRKVLSEMRSWTRERILRETSEMQAKSEVWFVVTYKCWFLHCDKGTVVISDVNNRENQVRDMPPPSMLSLQLFCNTKTAPK